MSGKLDQSLDEIMKDSNTGRPAGRRGRNGRLPNRKAATKSKAATTAVVAPTGGVQKKGRVPKGPKAPAVVAPQAIGESKISVSNLPEDITEALIKDYFVNIVGPVKRVIVNYGPNGRSRGSATVIFSKPTAAAAAAKLDRTPVDGRPMRIEVIMGAKSVPPPQPPKSLADRVQPKNAVKENQKKQQKKEAPAKAAANGAAKGDKPKKSARAGRPKKKTAEELDAEMQDYFGSGEGAATNGTAQPAPAVNGGDTGMDEVI